ncbi:MAG TPA: SMC family ATPase [Gemmatimonadaceae bacterium]|nr:SMC family ATPase [Gemmatimonadaceae bacterium]
MRLHSLQLSNFRQHLDTTIEFDAGLTGIIGPNGSGKTTILEAIAWALYGMPAARGTRDSIRSLRAKPRAAVRVELDFGLGGHRYRVSRALATAELYLDGAATPIANSISGVNELLRRRLGMTLDEFFNTYFTGQKELSVMAAMGPSERGQFLSRVLGYDRLRVAQGLVRDQRRQINAEASGLRGIMADPEEVARTHAEATHRLAIAAAASREATGRRAAAREHLEALTPRWDAMQHDRELLQALTAEQRLLEGEEAALCRDLARIAHECDEIERAGGALAEIRGELTALEGLRARVDEFERQAREDGRRQTLIESDRVLSEEQTRLGERRDRLVTAPRLVEESTAELEQIRTELAVAEERLALGHTEWVRDRQEAETKIQQLKEQLLDVREQRERLIRLGEEGTCPTCARPLGDHYRSVLDLLDEQIETVTVDGRYYRARIEQLQTMPADVAALDEARRQLQDALAKHERRAAKAQLAVQELLSVDRDLAAREARRAEIARQLHELSGTYDAARHAGARQEMERLVPLEATAARLSALVERAPQLAVERTGIDGRVAAIRMTLAELRDRRARLDVPDEAVRELRTRYELAVADLRKAELGAVAAEGEASGAQAALESAERARVDLVRAQEKLAALGRSRRLHDELDRAYSEMRVELNQQLRPEISALASQFLSELTDGRYTELELDASYNITVLEDGIPKPVISGGEEDLANLVLRLAISQMIAERAGQPLSLLILDEVFGSLDEARRQGVVDLLRRLQDRFEQVILISHIESVREDLDQILTVRYDDDAGVSRVDRGWTPATADEPDLAVKAIP